MKKIIWNIVRIILILTSLITSGLFIKLITDLDMLPDKYYLLIVLSLVVLNVLGIIGIMSKKIIGRIIGIIIFVLASIISIIGINYGTDTLRFLNKAFNNNGLEVTGYNVIVLKSSDYNKIDDLNEKTVGYLSIDTNKDKYMAVLKSKITCELKGYDNPYELYESLLDKKIDSIVIDSAYIDLLEDDYDDIRDRIKVIYNYEIELVNNNDNNKDKKKKESDSDIDWKYNDDSINILISGSDSRSGKIVTRTRSDVNMIMTINKKTHTILLTSIPRDYYVQLHNTTGNKDKLTHSGIYGVNMTKNTIEDLFEIRIDYTVKVGFQSVIKLVDLIGGIDIDSDASFTSHCGDGGAIKTKVKKGENHFNGGQALSYARERYAYKEGDVHRVQNQQQVLEAIIAKISKNKSILLKYEEFLDSFSELYRTDLPSSEIKSIIKDQLNTMSTWKVKKQYVKGTGASKQTYSMPGRNLYVMIPNEDSVKDARDYILDIYNGE